MSEEAEDFLEAINAPMNVWYDENHRRIWLLSVATIIIAGDYGLTMFQAYGEYDA